MSNPVNQDDVEKLRFIKRVLENFAGSALDDRVSAYRAASDLFLRWHQIVAAQPSQAPAEPVASKQIGTLWVYGDSWRVTKTESAPRLIAGTYPVYTTPQVVPEGLSDEQKKQLVIEFTVAVLAHARPTEHTRQVLNQAHNALIKGLGVSDRG